MGHSCSGISNTLILHVEGLPILILLKSITAKHFNTFFVGSLTNFYRTKERHPARLSSIQLDYMIAFFGAFSLPSLAAKFNYFWKSKFRSLQKVHWSSLYHKFYKLEYIHKLFVQIIHPVTNAPKGLLVTTGCRKSHLITTNTYINLISSQRYKLVQLFAWSVVHSISLYNSLQRGFDIPFPSFFTAQNGRPRLRDDG